jgi:sensor domain CHASE-containing protein
MAKLFNKVRKKLVSEKPSTTRTSNYLKYAIGEILLVVIGILIALQINNSNDLRKSREKELHYLKNIKTDVQLNIAELDKFLDTRKQLIASAKTVIEHFEGKPITNLSEFNELCIPIYGWQKYYQNNNTFQELINSGNLALISNDSIKSFLMNIEMQYKN